MAYIAIDRTKLISNQIAELVNQAIEFKQQAARVMAVINSATAGGATPANLESGDGGVPAGQGATVYAAVHDVIYYNANAMSDTILSSIDRG
jgi:hypothetical protein